MTAATQPAAALASLTWQELAQRVAAGSCPRYHDARIGARLYGIPHQSDPDAWLYVPGVTSVLAVDATPEDKERLEAWRQREIDAGRDPNAAAERGNKIHAGLEAWIRGEQPEFESEELADWYSGMDRHLHGYKDFLWSERPLRAGWEHCWSGPSEDPERLARVWNWTWGYAGTPDFIAVRENGMTILGDFKSATRPYYRSTSGRVPRFKAIGWKKYSKTVRQLCAYKLAVKETLDLDIDALHIIVGLPEKGEAQQFFVTGGELERATEQFKQAAQSFWAQLQARAAACTPA